MIDEKRTVELCDGVKNCKELKAVFDEPGFHVLLFNTKYVGNDNKEGTHSYTLVVAKEINVLHAFEDLSESLRDLRKDSPKTFTILLSAILNAARIEDFEKTMLSEALDKVKRRD